MQFVHRFAQLGHNCSASMSRIIFSHFQLDPTTGRRHSESHIDVFPLVQIRR